MRNAGFFMTAVHVYVFGPDGKPLHSIDPFKTSSENVNAALKSVANDLHLSPDRPVVKPKAMSRPLHMPAPDSVILHTTARDEIKGGVWREYPGEGWTIFPASSVASILGQGERWDLPSGITHEILKNYFPVTEDGRNIDRNRIEVAELHAKVVSTQPASVIAQLDGKVKMWRHFYQGKGEPLLIEAKIAGYIEFSADRKTILRWRLATGNATFGPASFVASSRLMPASLFIEETSGGITPSAN